MSRQESLDRLAIARRLREIGSLLALAGEAPFKARAYQRAADVIDRLDRDLASLVQEGRLQELPGIGRGLARVIEELHATGASAILGDLRRRFPPGAAELSRIPGLRLSRIAALHDALGIETIAELRAACEAGRVRGVRGMGEKTERQLLAKIQKLDAPPVVRMHLHRALALGDALLAHLRSSSAAGTVELAGELRRSAETVDRLVVVATSSAPDELVRHALALPRVAAILSRDERGCAATLLDGPAFELHVVDPERWPTELLYATGAPEHTRELEPLALQRGLALSRAGLVEASAARVPVATEAEVYARLGLPLIPPEVREGTGEVAAALAGALPGDLVAIGDLRGLIHCHTLYSDGRHSIEQMARAADAMGMQYLTITDHSPTASYAGGLPVDRLRAQWDEIARVQESVSVRLLRGTESDILADGRLDYPDAILEQLDIVIASVHARHKMDAHRMTERLVRAMRHPCFKIWGHALGRLVLSRPPIDCRVEEVLDAIAESRAAIEINGDPHRLDLPPRWIRAARERGIRFVVSTDAHSIAELENYRYGVAMARRGWVPRGEVVNALDAAAFTRAVSPVGRR
jgi:DNA polymerase (family 10)